MNWSSFKYLVKQGWHNMVANRLMTVASLGVLTACLVITGIAGILSVSVSNFVQSLGDKDMIEVFISDEATDEQIDSWRGSCRSLQTWPRASSSPRRRPWRI